MVTVGCCNDDCITKCYGFAFSVMQNGEYVITKEADANDS